MFWGRSSVMSATYRSMHSSQPYERDARWLRLSPRLGRCCFVRFPSLSWPFFFPFFFLFSFFFSPSVSGDLARPPWLPSLAHGPTCIQNIHFSPSPNFPLTPGRLPPSVSLSPPPGRLQCGARELLCRMAIGGGNISQRARGWQV